MFMYESQLKFFHKSILQTEPIVINRDFRMKHLSMKTKIQDKILKILTVFSSKINFFQSCVPSNRSPKLS